MPMFSKRHYERIAYILRRRVRYSESEAVNQIALDLAEMFEEDNPKFNRWRFEYACGLR